MSEDASPNDDHLNHNISPVNSNDVESGTDRVITDSHNTHQMVIDGNVEIINGDFVGRDKNVRSIIVGRDVIGSILITGDHNTVFVGDYERLSDAYIRPHSVFDRVNLEYFTGREWLLDEVDAFLENHDRGYFIIEASAGLGKTTFMAWLVKQRNYIHHFCELAPGLGGTAAALKSLAAQLAVAYELRPDGVLPSAATRPDFLYDLLTQAAQRRHQDEKVVIVVDALDEAGMPGNQNVLGLPTGLPEGVFFVVSQRPATATLTVKDANAPHQYLLFSADDDENQADMQRFLINAAQWPEIVRACQESQHHYTPEQFSTTLMDKCQGVWIYLYFVVHEIRQSERSPLDLATLPDGITQYYAHYWQQWRDTDETKWDEIYLPLLTMLAAAQEALSSQRLLEWSGAKITEQRLRRLLEERWRPFLVIDEQTQPTCYRFYHATLQEFFEGTAVQDPKSPQPPIMKDLAKATRSAHCALANRYLEIWGGLDRGLPELQKPEWRDYDNRYGLRHLAAHLAAAERTDELHTLLRTEWVYSEAVPYCRSGWRGWLDRWLGRQPTSQRGWYQNTWYTVREAVGQTDGYLADVNRAWRLAEQYGLDEIKLKPLGPRERVESGWQNKWIGLQCRYALVFASLNSHADNIRASLLVELVKKSVWLPAQGLFYARQVRDLRQRVKKLAALSSVLPDKKEQTEVLQEALSVARSIEGGDRDQALTDLIPCLVQCGDLEKALSVAYSIESSGYQDRVLADLIPRLAELGELDKALAVARSIKGSYDQDRTLTYLVPRLAERGDFERALAVAHSIKDKSKRERILINLALFPQQGQKMLLQEALLAVRSIKNDDDRASALIDLIPYLNGQESLDQALTVVSSIKDSINRVYTLASLVPLLPKEKQEMHWQEILQISRSIGPPQKRDGVRINLIHHFAKQGGIDQALLLARSIKDPDYRDQELRYLVLRLAERGSLERALSLARSIKHEGFRLECLAKLASLFSQGEHKKILQEALLQAHSIENSVAQANALTCLDPLLSLEQLQEELTVTRSIGDYDIRTYTLAKLLPCLAEQGSADEALALTSFIRNDSLLVDTLVDINSFLSLGQLQEALAVAHSINDRTHRAAALANLVPHLAELEGLDQALLLARSIKDPDYRDYALAYLVPRLVKQDRISQAMAVARSIRRKFYRVEALVNLASHLSQGEQELILQEALSVARSIMDRDSREEAIENLSQPLTNQEEYRYVRLELYSIEHYYHRDKSLANFAPFLSSELSQTDRYTLWCEKLGTLSLRRRTDLLSDLATLSKVIAHLGGSSATLETIQAIQDVGRWWP